MEETESSHVFSSSSNVPALNVYEAMQSDYLDTGDSLILASDNDSSPADNFSMIFSASSGGVTNLTGNETSVSGGRDEDLAKIEIAILTVIFVMTVLGNLIVIAGIYFRRQKMTRMYYFILHLSIADLVTAFFNVLTQLFWELTYRFQGGNILCKFIKYAQILGPYSSSYVLIMTALDRYQAICFPLTNCSWTAHRSKLMLATAWTLAFLFCIPQAFIFSYQEPWPATHPGIYDCWATFAETWGAKAYVTWYCITVFIIPLMILVFAYSCICRTIWVSFSIKNAIRRHEFSPRNTSPDSDAEDTENSINDHDHDAREGSSRNLHHVDKNTRFDNASRSDDLTTKGLEVSWLRDTKNDSGKSRTFATSTSKASSSPINPKSRCQSNSEVYASHFCENRDLSNSLIAHQHKNELISSSLNGENEIEDRSGNISISIPKASQVDIIPNGKITSSIKYGDKSKLKNKATAKIYKWTSPTKRARQNSIEESSSSSHLPENNETRPALTNRKSSCKQFLLMSGKNRKNTNYTESKKPGSRTQPRTHTMKGISRAKIKTVKLTVTVICCYIFCSSPFIAAQLWFAYDPDAIHSPFYSGATFTILTLLASLNSCVNPWIFLFFNPNLLQDFMRGFCRPGFSRRRNGGNSPVSHMSRGTSHAFVNRSVRTPNRNVSVRTHHTNTNSATTLSSLRPTTPINIIPSKNNHNHSESSVGEKDRNRSGKIIAREETRNLDENTNSITCIPMTESTHTNGNCSLVRETSFTTKNNNASMNPSENCALWQCD